ncbi:hypothetical protein EB118_17640 [bacterium]|nr:hypothetical protein [bacterium]NDC95531.1 hypothetical protein [bacterium]NDD85149.1 hypothetical protein [bacterium]NDG31882.1 hypothetical protein [bacterium]
MGVEDAVALKGDSGSVARGGAGGDHMNVVAIVADDISGEVVDFGRDKVFEDIKSAAGFGEFKGEGERKGVLEVEVFFFVTIKREEAVLFVGVDTGDGEAEEGIAVENMESGEGESVLDGVVVGYA